MIEAWQLKQLQSLSLRAKVERSKRKIREAYSHFEGGVYVSLSGRDSAVMLDLVREQYPDVPAVYCDTGLEYPEVREYIKSIENVTWLRPKMTFKETIKRYGFPVVSKEVSQKINEYRNTKSEKLRNKRWNGDDNKYKSGKIPVKWRPLCSAPFSVGHKCCDVMKKRPAHKYEKETGRSAFIGTMASDSKFRRQSYLRNTCNAFNLKRPHSTPLSIWSHQNVIDYVEQNEIAIPSCYPATDHTGCMFCMFGVHLEPEPNRFQRMRITHPKQYKYCMEKLGLKEVLGFIGVNYE